MFAGKIFDPSFIPIKTNTHTQKTPEAIVQSCRCYVCSFILIRRKTRSNQGHFALIMKQLQRLNVSHSFQRYGRVLASFSGWIWLNIHLKEEGLCNTDTIWVTFTYRNATISHTHQHCSAVATAKSWRPSMKSLLSRSKLQSGRC